MSIDANSLSDLVGEVVTFTVSDGSEVKGTVANGSPIGVLVRKRGQGKLELIEAGEIESYEVSSEKDGIAAFKSRRIGFVKEGGVRQHLLDRHGCTLNFLNGNDGESTSPLSEEEAVRYHDNTDHSSMGHYHAEPRKKETSTEAVVVEESDDNDE